MSAETYTGKPCAHGHTLRYRSNRKCVACNRLEVRYFAIRPDGYIEPVTDELEDPSRHSTYWRATRIDSS